MKTLKQFVEDSIISSPETIDEALAGYLEDGVDFLDEKELIDLKTQLQNNKYKDFFLKKLCMTSLILVFTAKEVMGPLSEEDGGEPFDYEEYVKEFLEDSKTDDKNVYTAKMYYLANLIAEEVNISIDSFDIVEAEGTKEYEELKNNIEKVAMKYDQLRIQLLSKYERVVH